MGDELQGPDVVARDAHAWVRGAVRLMNFVLCEEMDVGNVNPCGCCGVVVSFGLLDFRLGEEEGNVTALYQVGLFLFACVADDFDEVGDGVML